MNLSVTRNSGSIVEGDPDLAVAVEDGSDILQFCPGGCKKKVLFFGFNPYSDWGDQLKDAMCLECRTKLVKEM